METPNLSPSSLSLPLESGTLDPALPLPWIADPSGGRPGRKGKAAKRSIGSAANFPILDRCVIALTIVTAASLVFNGYATKPSHSRELLPVMVLTSAR